MKRKKHTLEEILERTYYHDDCMIWEGGYHKLGYAMIRHGNEMRTVHSVIAEFKYGQRPTKYSGVRVTRTCKNRGCCNPDHIIIKDAGQIMLDRDPENVGGRKGKLTDDEIRYIRKEMRKKIYGRGSALAEELNVSGNTIYAIMAGKLYRKVKDET
jgi:hypothetical protein